MRFFCILFILVVVTTYSFLAVEYGVPAYRMLNNTPQVEQFLSSALQQPVHIGHIAAHWKGFQPSIEINDFLITDASHTPKLQIKKLTFGINLFASFVKSKIIPGDIRLEGTHLILREKPNGIININDVPALEAQLHAKNSEKLDYLLDCFLTSGNKFAKDIDITWYDQMGNITLPIKQLTFKEESSFLSHHFWAKATVWNKSPLNFSGNIYGNFVAKSLLYTQIRLSASSIPLENNNLVNRFTKEFTVKEGSAKIQMNFNIKPEHKLRANGELQAAEVQILADRSKKSYPIKQASAHFVWRYHQNNWFFMLKHLQLRVADKLIPIHKFSLRQTNRQNTVIQTLKLDKLPIQEVSKFLIENQLLAEKSLTMLEQLKPTGQIQRFSLRKKGHDLAVMGNLKNISFLPWQHYPGIENLNGQLYVHPKGGTLNLNSAATMLSYKKIFRENLPIEKVNGQVSWFQNKQHNWNIKIKNFNASTQDGRVAGGMNILIPSDNHSPLIQSKMNFSVIDASRISKYYPVNIMSPKVVKWLDHSIKGGRISEGFFVLNGQMKEFPFDQSQGKFLIQANLQNGVLHYQDGWPDVSDIKAGLLFEGRSMLISSRFAKTLGAKIAFAEAKIDNFEKPILRIKGQVSAQSNQQVSVNKSNNPLLKFINYEPFTNLNVKGKWQLGLNLVLPLEKDSKDKAKFQGVVNFDNTQLNLDKNIMFKDLSGKLLFKEDSAESQLITGTLFSKPFHLTISQSDINQTKFTKMNLQGEVSIAEASRFLNSKLLQHLQGSTPFHATLDIAKPITGRAKTLLAIESNLQGLESNLPYPLNKNASYPTPSYFGLEQTDSSKTYTFKYGTSLNGLLKFKKNQNQFEFERGDIEINSLKAQLPSNPILKIAGKLPEFNWIKWQAIFNQEKSTQNESSTEKIKKLKLMNPQLDLYIDRIFMPDFTLQEGHFKTNPKNGSLAITMSSQSLQGEIQIPDAFPEMPMKISMESLTLPDNHTKKNNLSPRDIPPLDLSVTNFNYHNKLIKNFDIKLRPQGNNLFIKQVSIKEDSLLIAANGVWREMNGYDETKLTGRFESSNLGAILNQWQITDNVVKGSGSARFNLTWANSPFNLDSKSLDGTMDLHFNKGRIIKLSNQAKFGMDMGRVLTLFSLQTLQRRLMLDFSDLTEPGFSFDEMQGTLQFKQGNVFTDNAYIDGPVAKVRINGRIGLAGKDYNLRLIINPYVTSSLPVVATLTAGPIVGAATWLVDKVFSHQVKKMTEIHYNVTGTWDNPNLKNLSETPH